ncbi:MAG TPA: dienelactone hydrolase family protein [Mycobacteriales bacterium]|nr:dienelactone hydrolase family protein [Mycobacteriales bacterium]
MGTEVTLGAAGRSGRGYLSEPGLAGPGVVIVHDEFGLLPHVRERCDWLAEAGFVALAIDLFDGRTARTPEEAERLGAGLDTWRARGLLATAATQLLARPKVRPQRVGAVGFGLGGRLALLTATTGALDVIVAFYAILTSAERSLVPCPTLLHLTGGPGDQDQDTRAFLQDLRTSGTEVTARTWSGVPPGFANADRPAYLEKPTVAAWIETAGFLAGHLRR